MIKFKILIVFANADDLDEKKSQCGYTLCRGNDLRHSNKFKKKHCSFITTLSLGMHQESGKPQLNLIIPIAKPSSERQINNRNDHCAMTSGGQR
jgi:hypothetical protein